MLQSEFLFRRVLSKCLINKNRFAENLKSKKHYEVPISRSFDEDLTEDDDDDDDDDDEDDIAEQDTLISSNDDDSDSGTDVDIGMEDILSDQSEDPNSEEYLEDYDTVTR